MKDEVYSVSAFPADDVRQVMWRIAGEVDLKKIVESARSVARSLVADRAAEGERHAGDGTEAGVCLLAALDAAGLGSAALGPEQGGLPPGARSRASALAALELAWVDAGAAARNLANCLAMQPIIGYGTPEQQQEYLGGGAPGKTGEDRSARRGVICLSREQGSGDGDAGAGCGKVSVSEWEDGHEPILRVDMRGRYTANMDVADFVLAAVESDDRRISGTCVVVLEKDDDGTFDRGDSAPTLGSQLACGSAPVFDLKVPASRIIGGYRIEDGVVIPNLDHRSILEPVFARGRVARAAMSAGQVLSAVESILGCHASCNEGQQQMSGIVRDRLVEIWSTGEAAASLAFAASQGLDVCDYLASSNGEDFLTHSQEAQNLAAEYLDLEGRPQGGRDAGRFEELRSDVRVGYQIQSAVTKVLSLAARLWNGSQGPAAMREALGLVSSSECAGDCFGLLEKCIDAQLVSAGDESETALRQQLCAAITDELFLSQIQQWILELRRLACMQPGTGACAVGSALDLWAWTLDHLRTNADADDEPIHSQQRQEAIMPLADGLCWLLAARCQILDVQELDSTGSAEADRDASHRQNVLFFSDLCHVQSARAAGEVGRICAELVVGYRRHPSWDVSCDACIQADEVDSLEVLMPGISYGMRSTGDVMETDGSHAEKAGPCVRMSGLQGFVSRRSKLDGCLTGTRLARERAAGALAGIGHPESSDYAK